MPTGYPDYQTPTNITAQDLDKLEADIVAQSIANLAVDIAAQSLTNLDVNINKQDLAEVAVDIAAQTVGNVGVDVAAQSVGNIAVDVAAQTLGTLDIAIDAADITGNLPIDIKAQSITGGVPIDIETQSLGELTTDVDTTKLDNLGIDVQTQSLSNLDVNVNTQSIGVRNWREWGEEQGQGINKIGSASSVASGNREVLISYVVSTGKTFYADFVGFGAGATGPVQVELANYTVGGDRAAWVNDTGDSESFAKPIKMGSDGDEIRVIVSHYTGTTCDLMAALGGREI